MRSEQDCAVRPGPKGKVQFVILTSDQSGSPYFVFNDPYVNTQDKRSLCQQFYRQFYGNDTNFEVMANNMASPDSPLKVLSNERGDLKVVIYDPSLLFSKAPVGAEERQLSSKLHSVLFPGKSSVIAHRAHQVRAVYAAGYEFPDWATEELLARKFDILPRVVVLYDADANLASVQAVATEREPATESEPANNSMQRHYDKDLMEQHFGWRTAAHWRFGSLPNIGVFSPTVLRMPGRLGGQRLLVHVHNAVGLTLDSHRHPDWIEYVQNTAADARARRMREFYVRVFSKVWATAKRGSFTTVVAPLVGDSSAGLYEDERGSGREHFQTRVWWPAFKSAFKSSGLRDSVDVFFMDTPASFDDQLRRAGSKDVGRFPDCVNQFSDRLDKVLFVNDWNGWSFVGNGNFQDGSLNGVMGRCTTLALSCWPVTNPYLSYAAV